MIKMVIASKSTFWVTNISKRDVALADLAITIRAMSSVNLLDAKHYPHLTVAILNKSEISGSLFKKQDKIKHRQIPPPEVPKEKIQCDTQAVIPIRPRSILEVKEEKYDELNIVDDEILNNINNLPNSNK